MMKKNEEISEIKKQLAANKYKLAQLDIQQSAYKLIINSAYGAISSRQNPVGDDDLGNAITLMGSTSIQHVNEIVIDFVRRKMIGNLEKEIAKNTENKEELKEELERIRKTDDIDGVLVANDTDSAMFSLSKCGVKICEDNKVTEEGYDLVEECDDFINEEFVKWYEALTNSHNCRLNFKREKICDYGIWLKKKDAGDEEDAEAKKHYVVHILDNEGVKHPKFKYTGVKFAKSTISNTLKDMGKKVIEHMIISQDRVSTDEMVNKLYSDFLALPVEERSILQRCQNIKKYDTGNNTYLKATPGHIRAALNYNRLIKSLNLVQYQPIQSGDITKLVYLESNKYGYECISYLDTYPKEFESIFNIDNKKMFEKLLYEEIKRYYKSVDWPSFNPSDGYAYSLFDLMNFS